MKYAIVIPDGAADAPLEQLDGKTPLQAANIPTMDWIATNGRCGTVANIPEGMPCGSDVAIISLLGYDPRDTYTGRAPLEAAALELKVSPDEWIFRCNLVTVVEGVMEDHSAGHISTKEAATLIATLNEQLATEQIKFHSGVGYRHLLTYSEEFDAKTIPPHDILEQEIRRNLPKGKNSKLLRELMEKSQEILTDHDINAVRTDLGENPANAIWLWGQGKMPTFDSFFKRFGVKGAAITAVDLIRGISKLIGWDLIEVDGATGYVDTNYAGKGTAAVKALDDHDIVCVHIEATDEAGHNADIEGKIHALQEIDSKIVAPVLERLKQEGDDWRILVLPDHPTPCTIRTHTSDPVPFAIAGKDMHNEVESKFTEQSAADADLHIERGCNMMEFFLTVR